MEQANTMIKIVYDALSDKKGEDICVIDISSISVLADYFVVVNGTNPNQVRALVDNVDEEMHKAGYNLIQREGYESANWVLMDFGDVIVHVFDRDSRQFYDIERIWRDGVLVENFN